MKKVLLMLALVLASGSPSWADTYATTPNPTAIFDTTTSTLYAIGNPANHVKSLVPGYGLTNTWTGTNTFSGVVNETGGVNITMGGVGIGTSTSTLSPLTIVGLGTSAPIGTTTGAVSVCVDSAGHLYGKASCP